MLNEPSELSVKKMEAADERTPTNQQNSVVDDSDTSRLVKDNSLLAMGKNSDFRLNKNVNEAPSLKSNTMLDHSAMSANQPL